MSGCIDGVQASSTGGVKDALKREDETTEGRADGEAVVFNCS